MIQSAPVIVCPSCHKPEERIEVCAHCGHKYEQDADFPVGGCIIVILVLIFGAWTFFVIMDWLIQFNEENKSLWEIVKAHWNWAKHLRII